MLLVFLSALCAKGVRSRLFETFVPMKTLPLMRDSCSKVRSNVHCMAPCSTWRQESLYLRQRLTASLYTPSKWRATKSW